ncbi:DUF397 domain-containing protein [Actinomadura viridis]|uniref:DUF397 domain-containing protein n=1 Tax=Actinomadura viridis TaxID=58110 RepID=UPI00369198C1
MPVWRTSSHSAAEGQCVQVIADRQRTAVAVRDSKDPHGTRITLSMAAWSALLHSVKTGGHDQP